MKQSPISGDAGQEFIYTLRIDAATWKPSRTNLQLSLAQLQHLADDFDLGRIIRMDVPLNTQCNTTEPFQTGQGTFLLRARHGEEFVERVEYLHFLIDGLIAHGFPAPPVIRSKKGKSWTHWGERIVEVHAFMPHDPGIHRDWRRMHAAASALGDLHRYLTETAEGVTPVPPEMRNDVTPRQCWMMLDEADAMLRRDYANAEQIEAGLEVIAHAKRLLEPLLHDYERTVGSLPWMMVHGDYHFWNILYRADQIASVVDYDFAQERERLFDVAYAMQSIISHMRAIQTKEISSASQLPWREARMWVDLYDDATHLPLTDIERKWLPREMLRIFLVSVATSAAQESPLNALLEIRSELPLFEWIGAQKNLFV